MTFNSNNQLKDFQEATVDYVFQRFTDSENQCNRFLVADEVGLGKTLVARGIIKKFYDHFKDIGKSQVNVIYICSNQSIASQNIGRLNIEKQKVCPTQINQLMI
jgi:superfamily II DNA or RNA helicase